MASGIATSGYRPRQSSFMPRKLGVQAKGAWQFESQGVIRGGALGSPPLPPPRILKFDTL